MLLLLLLLLMASQLLLHARLLELRGRLVRIAIALGLSRNHMKD